MNRGDFRMPDSWYDPPKERPEPPDDPLDPLDDGDYAYDRWRDEQMEEGDDDDEGFDPALDY